MSRIRDVWAPNLETEMANIRDLIEQYPYIAMVRPCLPLSTVSCRSLTVIAMFLFCI